MGVVAGAARRRWFLVLGAVAVLCSLPALVSALPLAAPATTPEQLRARILASSAVPFSGYAESHGALGLPDLPALGDVAALFGGTTRMRAWYDAPQRWRVDVVEPTGERGLYRDGFTTTVWDFERDQRTEIAGEPPVRLPRVTDLLPPDLARRLLSGSAGGDRLVPAEPRRVAGVRAAGLRLLPADPATLVGEVRMWADPGSGLPLEVRVSGRDGSGDVLVSRFLDLEVARPAAAALAPPRPPGSDLDATSAPDVAAWISRFIPYPLPGRLAGRARVLVPGEFTGVGAYGTGLTAFVVLPLPGRLGRRSFDSLRGSGAEQVQPGSAEGMLLRTSLVSALVVRQREGTRTFLLAGTVTPDLLVDAAAELLAAPGGEPVIVTRSLTKRFGRVLAVDAVDLDVRAGDRYGFLGPNGSGKTTLVRMLLGLVYATSGEIEVLGAAVPDRVGEVLPQVGALVEGPAAYGHLSGRANLALLDAAGPPGPGGGRRTRRARVAEALDRVGLGGVDDRPVRHYSLGMRQRLGLAGALLRAPKLLVLDEPTNGLDPQGIREIRELLVELNAAGTTVFLSSHLLAEVELLCTRVGVVDHGRLVLQEDLADLRRPTGRTLLRTPDTDGVVSLLDGRVEERDGDRLVVRAEDSAQLNSRLVRAGLRVTEIGPERRTLEQVVLAATGSGSDRMDRVEPRDTPGEQPGNLAARVADTDPGTGPGRPGGPSWTGGGRP